MNMKKYLIMVAVAMLGFASCTNDEDQREPQEINFSALNYKPTKAPIDGPTYAINDPSFGVYAAVDDGTNFKADLYMNDVKVKYSGEASYLTWRPTSWNAVNKVSDAYTKYYWPLSGSLTFLGYTPYGISTSFAPNTKTFKILNYSASINVEEQSDVMYSKLAQASNKSSNQNADGDVSYNGVRILFNHALSQIVFRAKTDITYADAEFVIDYIKVKNVLNTGNLEVEDDDVDNVAPAEGVTPIVDGWTTSGTAVDFQPVSNTSELSSVLAPYGDALLLIPQNFSNSVTVDIKYTMTPNNGLPSSKTVSITINDDTKINLDRINAGKKYFIDLTVSANEILFAPSVPVDWADQTAQPNQNL